MDLPPYQEYDNDDKHSRPVQKAIYFTVDGVFAILGIIGIVYMLSSYPDLRTDPNVEDYPWYYIMTWSGASLLPIANEILCQNNCIRVRINLFANLCLFGTWIWGWIIMSNCDTWNYISDEYENVRKLMLAYQIFYVFFGTFIHISMIKAIKTERTELSNESFA
jgi:hypothetical protein